MNDKFTRDTFNSLLAEVVDIAAGDSDEFKVKNYNGNRTFHYLRIPVTTSQNAFNNAKDWVNRAIHICCNSVEGDNNEPVGASWISNHLCRFYKSSVVEVLEKNEIHICHRMSLEVFSAATSAANLLISQAKIIARHLNNHFGKGICPTHKEMSSLSEGYRESKIGSIKWDYDQGCESNSNSIEKAECITWEVSDLSDDVAARLARELKSRNLQDPNHVQSVEIVVGGDHGGPAFIFGGSVTVKLQDEEAIKFELISCQLMCRKESAGLIEATVLPFLTKGLRTIIDKQLDISCGSDGEITCEFGDKGLKPLLFVTGDLAFQAAALGRESMSPHHCMHCQMKCSQFGNLNHEDGVAWTMPSYCDAGDIAAKELAGKRKRGTPKPDLKGMKKRPWWDFIPLICWVVPLLHCLIGIGNDLIHAFIYIVNTHIEPLTKSEIDTRREIALLEYTIVTTRATKNAWNASDDGKKLKSLNNKMKKKKASLANQTETEQSESDDDDIVDDSDDSVSSDDDDDDVNANVEIDDTSNPLPETEKAQHQRLQGVWDEMTKLIDNSNKRLKVLKGKMKEYRSATKKRPVSIESLLYDAMKEKGVEVQSYHGGALTGKDIRKVMDNATELFDTFASILKKHKKEGCIFTGDKIDLLCDQFKAVFVLWDGAFSYARKIDPTEEDCARYEEFITAAVIGHVNLGCSVTPKVHLMWKHTLYQMKNVPGGLGNKMEDWVERQHQDEARIRKRLSRMPNLQLRAITRSKISQATSHPLVIAQIAKVEAKSKKRKHSEKRESKLKRAKTERGARRVETLQGYGDNDKWILSEFLLDIETTTDETQTRCPHNEDKAEKSEEVGASKQEWVQCDQCEKWRKVHPQISADNLPDVWNCSMNTWDKNLASCSAAEEE